MLIIKNCLISTGISNDTKLVNIHINNEKIIKIEELGASKGSIKIKKGMDVIDAKGLLAIPGAIDPHVHFDTPGFEDREDFTHGTKAAAAGGVTTIIDMPCTSIPPVTSVKNLQNKLSIISSMAYVDFALWGGIAQNTMRGEDWFTNMEELWSAGVVGFKSYMISGMDTYRALTFMELGQVMQHAHKIGALVGVHSEDGKLIIERTEALKKEGKNSLQDYYFSRSEPAEKNGIVNAVALANQTKVRLHIVHLGSGEGAALIDLWKHKGLDLSVETCPHYLTFTHEDFEKYGSLIKTAPVVKEKSDRDMLWKYLSEGGIDFISTDHAPCQLSEKKTGNAWTDYGGMPGVELMLPFAFSEGYLKKRFSLARLIEVTSSSAAKRFGLFPRKGAIAVGSDADIVLIDPKKKWKVSAKKMHSKAKWTPFNGQTFTGKIIYTILRGKPISKIPCGRWIKRI